MLPHCGPPLPLGVPHKVEERREPAGKGKKDKSQLKWKPKVQPTETAEDKENDGVTEATPEVKEISSDK